MGNHDDTCDVCIIGGGPAGLAAALASQKRGLRVTVLERATPPIDKACGEGLLPNSLRALRELGVNVSAQDGHPLQGICFRSGNTAVKADFGNGNGVGLRRTVLHRRFSEQAERVGIRMLWGVKSASLEPGGVRADGTFFESSVVIGADGQHSGVRRAAGLDDIRYEVKRFGFRRHYRMAPWSPYVEIYWGSSGQFYITPVAKDEVCVAFVSRDAKLRLEQALPQFPALAERIRNVEPVSQEAGSLSVSRRLRSVYRHGVALAGDASGSVDAITGEGMHLAFKQAPALADAIASGGLSRYQTAHDKICANARRTSSLVLSLERTRPWIQKSLIAGLGLCPPLFKVLLEVHTGFAGWRESPPISSRQPDRTIPLGQE